MKRALYSASITDFLAASPEEVLGTIVENGPLSSLGHTQRRACVEEIQIMKTVLSQYKGRIYFEYAIPRMGKRIDVLVITGPIIIVLEFKVFQTESAEARIALEKLRGKYPIVITRDLASTKQWLRERARGSERYGIVVSSQAERLKPHAIDVKSPVDPVVWFLNGKDHVRSSYYLEDVDPTRNPNFYDPTFSYLKDIGFDSI
jgi:hypothetical protein